MGKTMRKTGILLAVICMIMAGLAIGGKRAEASSKGFMYTERGDGTLKITGYYGKKKNVTVPAKIKGKKVKEIGTYTFANTKYIKTLKISKGIKKIDDMAFFNLICLKKLILPKSVTSIAKNCGLGWSDAAEEFVPTTIVCYKKSKAFRYARKRLVSRGYKIKVR